MTAHDPIYVENTNGGNGVDHRLDPTRVVGEIEGGHHPDDVIASPDGALIYVNRPSPLSSGLGSPRATSANAGAALERSWKPRCVL
jgi:hypothetical protein